MKNLIMIMVCAVFAMMAFGFLSLFLTIIFTKIGFDIGALMVFSIFAILINPNSAVIIYIGLLALFWFIWEKQQETSK